MAKNPIPYITVTLVTFRSEYLFNQFFHISYFNFVHVDLKESQQKFTVIDLINQ